MAENLRRRPCLRWGGKRRSKVIVTGWYFRQKVVLTMRLSVDKTNPYISVLTHSGRHRRSVPPFQGKRHLAGQAVDMVRFLSRLVDSTAGC